MDFQNAEFYKLNKNNPDLIFNYATGTVTYRKEATPKGKLRIVEYRKDYDKKGTTRRVVPSYEFSVEDFDIWKQKLVDDSLEQRRHDDRTTRNNVNIDNLLETDLVATESVADEMIREEDERQAYERQTYKKVAYEPSKWREDEKSRPTEQGIVVGCEMIGKDTVGLVDTGDVHCISTAKVKPSLQPLRKYADDNFGFNVGEISIMAGEDFYGNIPKDNTFEAQEMAADIMGFKLEFDIESASGYVRMIDKNLFQYC